MFPGTSISFGFKKKSFTATGKKQQQNIANNNNIIVSGSREKDEKATIISNLNVIKAEQDNLVITGDDNGNSTNTGDYWTVGIDSHISQILSCGEQSFSTGISLLIMSLLTVIDTCVTFT